MSKKRLLALLLTAIMVMAMIVPVAPVSAAWGDDVQMLTVNAGSDGNTATDTNAPDGQKAWSLNTGTSKAGGPWDNLFTPGIPADKDLSAYKEGYFVFEMYIPSEAFKSMSGNNWLVIVSDGNNDFNTNSRLNLNLSGVTGGTVGTWATVYTKLTSVSGFNSDWLGQVNRLAMHMQWGASVPATAVYIKNPRFQKSADVPVSPQTIPSFDKSTFTATAAAPATGQEVEFAITTDGSAPTVWFDGTLDGAAYKYTFDTQTAVSYYVFARAKSSTAFPFVGASTRVLVSTKTDAEWVAETKAYLTWDVIKNANADVADVKTQLVLPTAKDLTTISWATSEAATITTAGVVNRLNDRENDKTANLTATITMGTASDTVVFPLTVKAVPAATDAILAPKFIESDSTAATAPDGNVGRIADKARVNGAREKIWQGRFIGDGDQNLIAYANQYFVFDMYVTDASLLNVNANGNTWLAISSANNDIDTNSRLRLNTTDIRNAKVGEWFTVYTQLSTSNSTNSFNPNNLEVAQEGRLQIQWSADTKGDVYIKNARFQPTNDSPKPIATGVVSGANIAVSASAPSNGQAVEFAVTDGTAPTAWTAGTKLDDNYSATVVMPVGDIAFMYARTVQDATYPFAGTFTKTEYFGEARSIEDAAEKLTWDAIKGTNTARDGVRTDLVLPTSGANGTTIAWTTSNATYISDAGVVTRHNDDNQDVKLTATITKGSATPATIVFDLVVVSVESDPAVGFIDFNDASTFTQINNLGPEAVAGYQGQGIGVSIPGDSKDIASSTPSHANNSAGIKGMQVGDFMYVLVTDPRLMRANKVTLEIEYWRTGTGTIPLKYNTIYAGEFDGYDAYRSATLPRGGGSQTSNNNRWQTTSVVLNGIELATGRQNKGAILRFEQEGLVIRSIKITEIPPTDAEAVGLIAEALTWDAIKGANTKQDLVTKDLVLNKTGASKTTIEWKSSNEDVINSDTGVVTREVESVDVSLTATVKKGTASASKTFELTVRGLGEGTDEEAVAAMLEKLTWDYIRNMNPSEADGGMGKVTSQLGLPVLGDNMTDITWVSDKTTYLSNTGIIPTSRPDGEGAVVLKATITRGTVSETKTFNLTIPARSDFAKYMRTAISQVNAAKDYAVSDFNVLAYGAKTEAMVLAEAQAKATLLGKDVSEVIVEFCNRKAFQAAIDAAYADGGGVVYAPAGTYAFRTETTATRSVTTVNGNETFTYRLVLNLRAGVQIRGEWDNQDAAGYDGKIDGTILAVYAGHNSANYDTYVDNDERENQTGGKKVANVSDRFVDMEQGTGVTNLSVWYPNQDISATTEVEERGSDGQKTGNMINIKGIPYPWTFVQRTGNSATLDNVTLVNSWGGFISFPSEMHYVVNSNMTALYKGIVVHTCTDIGRIENVNIDPKYWAASGLPGAPSLQDVKAFTKSYATGFMMHRSDWEYVAGLKVVGYKNGMWVGREPGATETPNAQFYGLTIEDCQTGIYVDAVNGFGLLISNSIFGGDVAARFSNSFSTSTQFNGVEFKGPIVSEANGGVISFEDCIFGNYSTYALDLQNRGNVLISQSNFKQPTNHVNIATNVNSFKSVNSGYNLNVNAANLSSLVLDYKKVGNATVQIVNDKEFVFEPIPKNVKTDIAVHPKPASNAVLRVDLPRSLTNTAPATDVATELQAALDYLKTNHGGGTLYLPGGRYLVNSPIIVPEGVEIRGTWDVQHHTQGGGTAIFTRYGADTAGPSLIQLKKNAGVRGISIKQIDITSANNPKEYPFLVQGQGSGVYAINLTIPLGDKGIDLASYKTDGHYVDYLGGAVLRAGIWVGGGAEGGFIRNMQFNPHYALRNPGGQGYSSPSGDLYTFVQGNCSALKFADVQDQTIFNNFVFGSVYGIHFLKRDLGDGTFAYPGSMTMIGHGSDGCTYALFVEDADADTKIIAINSELVNTNITSQPERAYVRMGEPDAAGKIDAKAELALFNSAFWGSPSRAAALVYGGNVRFQQANFTQLPSNYPGIDVHGGQAHVYTSYFQPTKNGNNNNVYALLRENGTSIELSNNYYASGLRNRTPENNPYGIYGADLMAEPFVYSLTKGAENFEFTFKYNIGGRSSLPGTVTLKAPLSYAASFAPVNFTALAAGESVTISLPKYIAALLTFEIKLSDGSTYEYTGKIDEAYAEKADPEATANPAKDAAVAEYVMDTKSYVTMGAWDGPQDLSVSAKYAWDDDNLYAYIVVTDDVHNATKTGGDVWQEDNLQLGVDLVNPATNSTTRNELGFTLTNSGSSLVHAWTRPSGANAPSSAVTNITANITRDEDAKTTTYDLTIPFNTLVANPATHLANGQIGVSIMMNESDSAGESGDTRSTYEVEGGHLKDSTLFTTLYLVDADAYYAVVEAEAIAAVETAVDTKAVIDIAKAQNYVAIMAEGDTKTELVEAIATLTYVPPIILPDDPEDEGGETTPPADGGSTIPTVPEAKPEIVITPEAVVEDGKISAEVAEEAVAEAVAQAKKENVSEITVRPEIKEDEKTDSVTIDLKTNSVQEFADAGLDVVVSTPVGEVTFNTAALEAIASQAEGESVQIVVEQVAADVLTEEQQQTIANTPGIIINLTVICDGEIISNFNTGLVKVSIPYELKAGEKAEGIKVYYLAEDGTLTSVICNYNASTKSVEFTVSHFSQYIIRYEEPAPAPWSNPFKDVKSSDWFYGDVQFAHQNFLFNGTSADEFSPNAAMTRGMLVTVLGRLNGVDTTQYTGSSFTDVKASEYYAPYIEWAMQSGIVKGIGKGKFAPDANITRQDLAVIIQRYADFVGKTIPATKKYTEFKDSAKIADYAKAAVVALYEGGIVNGKTNGFDPTGKATRAEVAAILHRFVDAVK